MSSSSEVPTSHVPPRDANTPTKIYTGGCHCGRFEFECRHPIVEDGFEVVKCNCSICTQKGVLAIYILEPEKDFKLLKGTREELSLYKFGTHVVSHMFCPTCGCTVCVAAGGLMGITMRSIKDVDLDKLTLKGFDGRAY